MTGEDSDRTQPHMAPQIGQCTNRLNPWEYAVVLRVVVRIPCEVGPQDGRDARSSPGRRGRPRPNVGAHGRRPAWLTDGGPPGSHIRTAPQTEARPRIGAELLSYHAR